MRPGARRAQPEPAVGDTAAGSDSGAVPEAAGGDDLGRIARGTTWSLLSQLLPTVVTVFFTPYVLHHLGVVRYGLYILTASLVGLIGTFDGGIKATAQRYFGVYAGRDDVAATTRLLVTLCALIGAAGVVLSVVGWFVAAPIVDLIHVPVRLRGESTYLFRTLGILITFGFLHNLFVAILYARHRFRFVAKAGFAVYAIWVLGLVATVQGGWGLRGVADVFVFQQVFLTVVVFPAALRYTSRADLGLMERAELSGFLRFGARVQVSTLTVLVNDKLDAIVVGAVRNATTVALYNSGSGFAENVTSVTGNAIGPAQASLTNRLGRDGEAAAYSTFLRLQQLWVVGVTGWFVVAAAAAWWAVTAWLGPQFDLGGTVAIVALAGTLLYSLGALIRTWCSVVGKPGVESRAGVVAVVVNLATTVPLAFAGGAVGVVVATALGQLAGLVTLVRLARREVATDLPDPLRRLPLLAGALAAAVVVGGEVLLRPVVPGGGFGLLVSGLPVAPGLVVFGVVALGWSTSRQLVAAALQRARGGQWESPAALSGVGA